MSIIKNLNSENNNKQSKVGMKQIESLKRAVTGQKYKLELYSQNFEHALGDFCTFCQTRLKEEQVISVCRCMLFCHEDCFVKQLSPYLSMKSEVKCKRCDHVINFTMNVTTEWVCNRRPTYILSIIGSLLFMFGLYLIIADGVYRPYVSDAVSYSVLSCILLLLILAIIRSSRRKLTKIEDIRVINTNLLSKGETQKGLVEKDMQETRTNAAIRTNKLGDTVSRVQLAEYEMM